MHTLEIKESQSNSNLLSIINANHKKPGLAWLDSTMQVGDKGLNSLLAYEPIGSVILTTSGLKINGLNLSEKELGSSNIYNITESIVKKNNLTAIGFISYEAMLENVNVKSVKISKHIPLAGFYFYKSPLLFSNQIDIEKTEFYNQNDRDIKSRIVSSILKEEYLNKVIKIKDHIREGDIYQANFTTRFVVESDANPFDVYLNLRKLNPSPYGSFINFGDFQIISSSPERMFTSDSATIKSDPIKGTIPIGKNESEKNYNRQRLLASEKDKAELLMIVDLVRNDLGKIAKTGTVNVDKLFKAEEYSSLIHLVSSVSAKLKENVSFAEQSKALMPGGSITGTPKKRAVEILNELEQFPRSVYTGCIGVLTPEYADFNIAIRTMICYNNRWHIHAGGGIVADSDPEHEYNEMLLKTKNMFSSLGIKIDENSFA